MKAFSSASTPSLTSVTRKIIYSQRRSNIWQRWLPIVLFISLLVIIIVEVILRNVYGFTDAVLFKNDAQFEYIAIPQRRFRFRKHIFYNRYSQRNREINPLDSIAVLSFGDSVINGGTQTDQDSLATTGLSAYLSQKYDKHLLVVNISAGSWGPDNCYAYLKKYGNFGAKSILLVVSSHDAYDDMNHEKVVGILPNYPDKQYSLAIAEAFSRYLFPRLRAQLFSDKKNSQAVKNESFQSDSVLVNKYYPGVKFNRGFAQFKHYADSTNSKLLIYLHAERSEMIAKKYNTQGDEIINFCSINSIPIIKELDYHFTEQDYRDDNFHLSEQGQRRMLNILKKYY
ncbi:MAG: hypothetical protein EOP45_09310 [Sphingobacteriaceae bacterium]|nr:MAG: hypothetical protein EOP45_09310 [Sphingobacteriaceae bacterium]